jgi:hypothetical protein
MPVGTKQTKESKYVHFVEMARNEIASIKSRYGV